MCCSFQRSHCWPPHFLCGLKVTPLDRCGSVRLLQPHRFILHLLIQFTHTHTQLSVSLNLLSASQQDTRSSSRWKAGVEGNKNVHNCMRKSTITPTLAAFQYFVLRKKNAFLAQSSFNSNVYRCKYILSTTNCSVNIVGVHHVMCEL